MISSGLFSKGKRSHASRPKVANNRCRRYSTERVRSSLNPSISGLGAVCSPRGRDSLAIEWYGASSLVHDAEQARARKEAEEQKEGAGKAVSGTVNMEAPRDP